MTTRINLDGTSKFVEDDSQEILKTRSDSFHWMEWPTAWQDLRDYRETKLAQSDWTQVSDGPLDSTTKAAWATYRAKLRDIPANAGAPLQIPDADWPLAPGEASIPEDAVRFVKSGDPLGLGTTSWVAINNYTIPNYVKEVGLLVEAGIGTNIIKFDDISAVKVGDTLKYKYSDLDYESTVSSIGSSVATDIAGIGTVSLWPVSLGSTISVGLDTGSTVQIYTPLTQSNYYEQEKPSATIAIVGVNTTGISTGDTLNVTVSAKNVVDSFGLNWNLSAEEPNTVFEDSDFTVGSRSGTLQIAASSDRDVVAVSTVTFTFASSISIASTEYIQYINFNIPSENINSERVGISSI